MKRYSHSEVKCYRKAVTSSHTYVLVSLIGLSKVAFVPQSSASCSSSFRQNLSLEEAFSKEKFNVVSQAASNINIKQLLKLKTVFVG